MDGGCLTVKRPREIVPTNLQRAIADGILANVFDVSRQCLNRIDGVFD